MRHGSIRKPDLCLRFEKLPTTSFLGAFWGFCALLGLLLIGPSTSAWADKTEAGGIAIPQADGTSGKLKLRVLGYRGGTNGELSVEVENPSGAASEFEAQGLYFLPSGDPDHAPQRLGAVGPFQVESDKDQGRKTKVKVEPGSKVTLRLDVYCIDSHRRSPRTGDQFSLATQRMPKTLSREIYQKADVAADKVGGYAAPRAKSSVQSEVWKARDSKWIPLQGEGKQEATK